MGDATTTESFERALRSIELRARTLDDCLEVCCAEEEPSEVGVAYALDGWVKAFAPDRPEALARRLEWDGWDIEVVRQCLAGQADRRLPMSAVWTGLLSGALERRAEARKEFESAGCVAESGLFSGARIPPFFEIWVPFLRLGCQLARQRERELKGLLGEAAWRSLQRQLLVDLVSASVTAVYGWFGMARVIRLDAFSEVGASDRQSRRILDEFLHRMLEDGLPELLSRNPVLARQLCRLVDTWVDTVCELGGRLGRDRMQLEAEFGGSRKLGSLQGISTALSDRHRNGRQVRVLEFAAGRRLVYKPRDMVLEEAYHRLLTWLRGQGLATVPRSLRVIRRQGYGWMEHVEQQPAADRDEVRQYFRCAGGLLCLGWLLQGDDLHAENIIAAPGGPFLVDSETLAQPQRAPGSSERPIEPSWRRSQLLGAVHLDAAGRPFAGGGLEARGGQLEEEGRRYWRDCDTDALSFELRDCLAAPKPNVLFFQGEIQEPRQYIEELAEGFDRTYRFLIANRSRLLSDEGPLASFRHGRTRVILRPSELYGRILFLLRSPTYQRLGLTGSFLVDALNRRFNTFERRPPSWPLTVEERGSLQNLDVPYFDLASDRKEMTAASGEVIDDLFETSGFEAVVDQVAGLSIVDLDRQLDSLRRELDPGSARPAGAWPESWLLREARDLGRQIAERSAAGSSEGHGADIDWLKPDEFAGRGLSLNLYDGATGVALFLAALYRATRDAGYRRLALEALAPVEKWIDSDTAAETISPRGIGFCFGLGGLIYALVEISVLVEEARLLDLARSVALRLDSTAIAADRDLDLAAGAAGAIRGLLRLYDETGSGMAIERAEACGAHLMAARGPVEGADCLAWANQRGEFLTGLAHGASGIGYSLLELYEVRPAADYLEAARQALRYERRFRAADGLSWKSSDSRHQRPRRPAGVAWCSGVAGLGLARIGAPVDLADAEIGTDLEAALATLRHAPMSPSDSLCCGQGGGIELLLESGLARRDARWLRQAHQRAAEMIGRKRRNGGFALAADSKNEDAFDPTLFRGASGIGYLLLRLAAPGRLSPLTVVARGRREARRAGSMILAGGV